MDRAVARAVEGRVGDGLVTRVRWVACAKGWGEEVEGKGKQKGAVRLGKRRGNEEKKEREKETTRETTNKDQPNFCLVLSKSVRELLTERGFGEREDLVVQADVTEELVSGPLVDGCGFALALEPWS